MKRSHLLFIGFLICITPLFFISAQNLDNLTLIAHYPLSSTPNDTTGNHGPMNLVNTQYQDGGIYCNGIYPGGDPNACDAGTPTISYLDFVSMAVSVTFRVDEVEERKPVIVGGLSWRWLTLFTDVDTTVGFSWNGLFETAANSGVRFSPGTFHEMTTVYDSTENMARLYLDGIKVDSQAVTVQHHNDAQFQISHGGVGRVFKGILKDLKIYSKSNTGLEADSLALVALYNSTDGPNWVDNSNWLTGPVNLWYGVTMEQGRVTGINLAENGLSGPIPPEIGNLNRVENLNLNLNGLTESIPPEVGLMDSLKGFYLAANQLTGTIPDELYDILCLEEINLNSNQLEGSVSSNIGKLSKLRSFYAVNNQLSGPLPPEIGSLKKMQDLSLSGNQLSNSLPPEIGDMENLKKLDLYGNQMDGALPEEIGNLQNLQYLWLSENQFSDSIPKEVGNMSSLRDFFMSNNQLTGTIPVEMENLSNLEYLGVEDNQLSGAIPSGFSNLMNFVRISIQGNHFSELPDLSALPDLYRLEIQNNAFTFEDIEPNLSVGQFLYSPQDSVDEEQTVVAILGSSLTLTVSVGGANNTYQWYKDGAAIPGKTTDSYRINTISFTDQGDYYCEINNTLATELTLYSRPMHVITENVAVQEQDSLALVALYNSTDGDNWTDNTNWLSGPVGTWYGVTISGNRVMRVELAHNNLNGPLPADIENLDAMTQFLVRINNLNGSLPPEIGDLTNLEELDLYQCHFSDSLPSAIGNLTNLYDLDISDNNFSGAIPSAIGNLSNLNRLAARNNNFIGSIPSSIGNLSNLEDLYLYDNRLAGPVPAEIGQCAQMRYLYLYENQLTGAIPDNIVNMTGLERLYLEDNQLDDLPDLSVITSLQAVRIQENRFTFEDIEPNIDIPDFTYAPQDSVGETRDMSVTEGQALTIETNIGGSDNQYQWFKDGTEIPDSNVPDYSIATAVLSDSGTYACQITNTTAPDLTLYMRPVQVRIEPDTDVNEADVHVPLQYALHQNYPNPFNPETTIRFSVKEAGVVTLKVYNLTGQEVAVLADKLYRAGHHEVNFNAAGLSSGIYVYQIRINNFSAVKKLIVME